MLSNLKIKIFADGADYDQIINFNDNPLIQGMTTNPSLMKKAGISNYQEFCKKVCEKVKDKPLSFEVFTDDFKEMVRQSKIINSWGKNVFVKIPITNTKGQSSNQIIKELNNEGIKLNITAIFTKSQISELQKNLNPEIKNYISIFAGRIADTGIDPNDIMQFGITMANEINSEVIWASCREVLNIFQAEKVNCHIITVPHAILNKLNKIGYNLNEYSMDTVKEFYKDSLKAGFKL